jgi:hypothetical protein
MILHHWHCSGYYQCISLLDRSLKFSIPNLDSLRITQAKCSLRITQAKLVYALPKPGMLWIQISAETCQTDFH